MWGHHRDDVAKTHNLLLPFRYLKDDDQTLLRDTVSGTIKMVVGLGYEFVKAHRRGRRRLKEAGSAVAAVSPADTRSSKVRGSVASTATMGSASSVGDAASPSAATPTPIATGARAAGAVDSPKTLKKRKSAPVASPTARLQSGDSDSGSAGGIMDSDGDGLALGSTLTVGKPAVMTALQRFRSAGNSVAGRGRSPSGRGRGRGRMGLLGVREGGHDASDGEHSRLAERFASLEQHVRALTAVITKAAGIPLHDLNEAKSDPEATDGSTIHSDSSPIRSELPGSVADESDAAEG